MDLSRTIFHDFVPNLSLLNPFNLYMYYIETEDMLYNDYVNDFSRNLKEYMRDLKRPRSVYVADTQCLPVADPPKTPQIAIPQLQGDKQAPN